MSALSYDPATGVFVWNISLGHRRDAGAIAGCPSKRDGYIHIGLDGKVYCAHRLAWLYFYGRWPENQIDHTNGDRRDNRICNLREATDAQNRQNIGKRKDNSSGLIGVGWRKQRRKWCAQIQVSGKNKYLGLFENIEEARTAYLAAKAELHSFNPTPRG